MPYVEPNATNLLARYPEFSNIDDPRITVLIGEALREVDDSWIEADRAPAVLALTAHLLASDPNRTSSGNGSVTVEGVTYETAGAISSVQVGDNKVTFGSGRASGSSSTGSADDLASTVYGRRFLQLMRRSHPPIVVV
jgi:hypothetical protein